MTYERPIITTALCAVLSFALYDLVEDTQANSPKAQVVQDLLDAGIILALLIYIWVFRPLTSWRRAMALELQQARQSKDTARLARIARHHLEGLGLYIEAEFRNWGLTPAERDVGLLLLKGFSLQEISRLRQITERTARQQATAIYSKSGLSGRAALSGFFLEELLLPDASLHKTETP